MLYYVRVVRSCDVECRHRQGGESLGDSDREAATRVISSRQASEGRTGRPRRENEY